MNSLTFSDIKEKWAFSAELSHDVVTRGSNLYLSVSQNGYLVKELKLEERKEMGFLFLQWYYLMVNASSIYHNLKSTCLFHFLYQWQLRYVCVYVCAPNKQIVIKSFY